MTPLHLDWEEKTVCHQALLPWTIHLLCNKQEGDCVSALRILESSGPRPHTPRAHFSVPTLLQGRSSVAGVKFGMPEETSGWHLCGPSLSNEVFLVRDSGCQ